MFSEIQTLVYELGSDAFRQKFRPTLNMFRVQDGTIAEH
jgi:hypothetical protein